MLVVDDVERVLLLGLGKSWAIDLFDLRFRRHLATNESYAWPYVLYALPYHDHGEHQTTSR